MEIMFRVTPDQSPLVHHSRERFIGMGGLWLTSLRGSLAQGEMNGKGARTPDRVSKFPGLLWLSGWGDQFLSCFTSGSSFPPGSPSTGPNDTLQG